MLPYRRWLWLCVVISSFAAAVTPAGAAEKQKPVVIPEGDTVVGRCVGVHDGDSMTLLVDTPAGPRQSKIRMDAIDAPELGQPFSNRSKQALSGMVFDKSCDVESLGPDKYGRTIGRVAVDGKDVNAAMLEAGMAWHYAKHDDRQAMADRHQAARKAGIGLWADPEADPAVGLAEDVEGGTEAISRSRGGEVAEITSRSIPW